MWFYDIINVIVAIAVIVAILYLLFRLFVLKQGNERVILLPKRKTSFQLADMNMSSMTLFCDRSEERRVVKNFRSRLYP